MSVLAHNNKIIIAPNGKTLNMQSLINIANAATGGNDATLANALDSLIDPYADINTAINAKGVSGTFLPSEMAAAIARIPSGGGLLPSGIKPCEYIHGGENCVIDTLISASLDVEIAIKMRITDTTREQFFVGTRRTSGGDDRMFLYGTGTTFTYRAANQGITNAAISQNVDALMNRYGISINDTVYPFSGTPNPLNPPDTITIFNIRTDGVYESRYGEFDISYCHIYDAGNLMRNFVPCFVEDTDEAGLYDFVSQSFFGNALSGTITHGPEIITAEDFLNELEAIL